MNRFAGILGLFVLLFAVGCADEALLAPDRSEVVAAPVDDGYAALVAEMEALEATLEGGLSALAKQGNVVKVPAGSHDALAAAIAQAGPGGTVLLRSGEHTESGTVKIEQQVEIVGESGAVLEVDTRAWGPDHGTYIQPALHVLNTSKVVIWGVEIRPLVDPGGVAILVESSTHTVIGETGLYDHQFGIINMGDNTRIWKNIVVTTPRGPGFGPFTPIGIANVVGGHVIVARNDVSNAVTGIFASDEKGLMTRNETHHNILGVILCNFTPMPGPSGTIIKAEFAATRWVVTHNNAHDNGFVGYFVFDGANRNLLSNNAASNNAAFDIELTAEQERPGLPNAPVTFENHVFVGRSDMKIKDCGMNNQVHGDRGFSAIRDFVNRSDCP